MASKALIQLLQKQKIEHEVLLVLSKEKTEVVKEEKMDELDRIIKAEQRQILAIDALEKERIGIVYRIMSGRLLGSSVPTLSECLDIMEEEDRESLLVIQEELRVVLMELQERNALNQQLIQQSLQFVNMSLGSAAQKERKINYKPTQGNPDIRHQHAMFQSEA